MALFGTKEPARPAGVADCERAIDEALAAKRDQIFRLGAAFAAKYTVDTAASDFHPFLNEITALDEKIKNLEVKKLALQGLRKCEQCGNVLPVDSGFCNKCGIKLDPITYLISEADSASGSNSKVCPNCGNLVEDDEVFCAHCGNKLG